MDDDPVKQRFEANIAEHKLSVLRDDGLYRHVRCQQPGKWIYRFDVVTWPGYLAIVGDAGDFLFTRIPDMFEFFESEQGRINPHYWSEKLRGPGPAFQAAMEFDELAYQAYVRDHNLEDKVEEGDYGPPHTKDDAIRLLVGAGADPFELPPFERYSVQFLWCCHAIVWAIGQYRTSTEAVPA